jgi:SAM-dependent methyltransferase
MPELYSSIADWWPLLSPPEDYVADAAWIATQMTDVAQGSVQSILELGSGGGHNAVHLKGKFVLTLSDIAEGMIAASRRLNPECTHHVGDMRDLRLSQSFDAVLIHDAVSYLTTVSDVHAALHTAAVHCRTGGVVVIAPDFLSETFHSSTTSGGHDGADGRALRFLEWIWDPDPSDTTYRMDFAMMLHEPDGNVRHVADHHTLGLFSRSTWLTALTEVGFDARVVCYEHGQYEPGVSEVFVCRKLSAGSSSDKR